MVGRRADIEVAGFLWESGPDENIAHCAQHDVTMEDVSAVRESSPLFFENLPGRSATHVMIGRDGRGRSLFIALLPTDTQAIWKPVTGWQSALAHAILEAEGRA